MNLIYRIAQNVSFIYFKLFHGFEVRGLENIPREGSFILASNHLSFFDPPALGCKLPRNLHYFARDSLFFGPLGFLIKRLNSIPVNRENLDLKTLRLVLKVLGNGNPLLVFPEGTRSRNGKPGSPQKGVGLLVVKSGVPVLPVRIQGTFEIFGPGRIFPRIGKKLKLTYGNLYPNSTIDPNPDEEDRYKKIGDRIMAAIYSIEQS